MKLFERKKKNVRANAPAGSAAFLIGLPVCIPLIQRRCMQSTKALFKSLVNELGFSEHYNQKKDHTYCYLDRGNKVLVVAHADSVQSARFFTREGNLVFSPSLDDRLGVAVAVDLLPLLGIDCDVLITDEEEFGNSSASSFVPSHDYNWIAEFDRGGGGVVTYSYDNQAWEAALMGAGFTIEMGLYSDICEMEGLGISAVNIGIGYEQYHSINSFADLSTMDANLKRFVKFHSKYAGKKFAHEERRAYRYPENDLGRFDAHRRVEAFHRRCTKEKSLNRRLMCENCGDVFWEEDVYVNREVVMCPTCFEALYTDDAAATYEFFARSFSEKRRTDVDVCGWN